MNIALCKFWAIDFISAIFGAKYLANMIFWLFISLLRFALCQFWFIYFITVNIWLMRNLASATFPQSQKSPGCVLTLVENYSSTIKSRTPFLMSTFSPKLTVNKLEFDVIKNLQVRLLTQLPLLSRLRLLM